MKKTNINILAVIPARMASSRFPGKPMAKILDKPMIGHVYERVIQCNIINKTIVATCDSEIAEYIESIGGEAIMTSSLHERASDRCAEALEYIEKKDNITYDIVVLVQGDEPMTHPDMIEEAVLPMLDDNEIPVSNLLGKISSIEEFIDKNCIKVVCDIKSNAIYFSREPIPSRSKIENIEIHKQVCIIPFRRDFLILYNSLDPTPLEIAESVDMMRVIEHGFTIRMTPTDYQTYAVDTPEDLIKVEALMKLSLANI